MIMDGEQEVLELEGKFKTADELGLGEEQRCGLVKTLAYIEAGKLMHVSWGHLMAGLSSVAPLMPFNMRTWFSRHSCGTVCCIGGTAQMLGGARYPERATPYQLRVLFGLIDHEYDSMDDITERQAGVALRGYLETGTTDWDAARKSPR